jgi:hypothetical protein
MRQAKDEDRAGEVLEPGAAGREGVADEIRRELPRRDEPDGRARPNRPGRGAGLPDGLCYAPPALWRAA